MMHSDDSTASATGACLCGGVRFELAGPLRDVVICHCAMCRKTHGHIGAYTAVSKASLRLTEARALKWYRSSPGVRRGFCGECGASLFWDAEARDSISVAAGMLDPPTGLETSLQIHVSSAGDYYNVATDVPQRAD